MNTTVYALLRNWCLSEYIGNRNINFWLTVANDGNNKISPMLYIFLRRMYNKNTYKSPWITKINILLNNCGMTNAFNDVIGINNTWLKEAFNLRCNNIYKHKYSESLTVSQLQDYD